MVDSWRVLIADDDMEICSLIQAILRRGPYALTICNDAESALALLEQGESFDLIICDFMLPGISGIELIARVRATPASSEVPVVLISGHDNDAMETLARRAGANAFLTKPFTLRALRSTVQTMLDARLSAASSP